MDKQHQTGVTSELYAAYILSSKGFKIYFPFMTQSKADFLIEDSDGCFHKVQVKTATEFSKGYIQIRLGGCGRGEYKEGDFDFLVMVHGKRVWMFPWGFVKGKKSMSFPCIPKKTSRNIECYEIKEKIWVKKT